MVSMKLTIGACLVLAIFCIHYSNGQIARVRSLHRQCVDQGFVGVCRSTGTRDPTARNRCSQTLQCAVRSGRNNLKQPGGSVPNGTPCGTNKICMTRRCVDARNMPQVVGSISTVTCGRVVTRAERIQKRQIQPLR